MEVTVAKSAGFCFGVQRAVDSVYSEIAKGSKPIYTFGPIIHNEQVVSDLESKGVQVIHSIEALQTIQNGTVIIRSHGSGLWMPPVRLLKKFTTLCVKKVKKGKSF